MASAPGPTDHCPCLDMESSTCRLFWANVCSRHLASADLWLIPRSSQAAQANRLIQLGLPEGKDPRSALSQGWSSRASLGQCSSSDCSPQPGWTLTQWTLRDLLWVLLLSQRDLAKRTHWGSATSCERLAMWTGRAAHHPPSYLPPVPVASQRRCRKHRKGPRTRHAAPELVL